MVSCGCCSSLPSELAPLTTLSGACRFAVQVDVVEVEDEADEEEEEDEDEE